MTDRIVGAANLTDVKQRTLGTGQVVFDYDGKTFESLTELQDAMLRRIVGAEGLEAAILADELADAHEAALEGTIKMPVREYAKFKKIQPQLLYYYLRMGYIKEETCICGRKVLDVASADAYLAGKAAKKRSES